MNNKTVLVTGSSGFIGSHVADSLEEQGFNVVLFDAVTSKYKSKSQKEFIGDILKPGDIDKAMGIYHFSGDRDISYSEAAKIGCATLGFDPNLVKPKKAKELGYNGPLFKKTSLDIIKTQELLGINAPKVEWTIARAFKSI